MSAQQKLTSTWNCVFWADLRLPLSGRQMSSLSLSVSTFHQTSSKKISGNLSPLTSEFPGPVPVASENDLEDTKTIQLDAATIATICYLHPSKRFFGSQTWDSKPPHRREVDRWVARTQKELPRESLATSLVKCWETTREFERRDWAKSLRSAQAAWQNEEHVVSQDKMQNGSSTHIVSCVSMRPICISPYQCNQRGCGKWLNTIV